MDDRKRKVARPVLQVSTAPVKGDTSFSFTRRKLAFLLSLIAFAVYANTLKNGFVFDDNSVITKNTIVTQGVAGMPEIFSTPYRKGYYVTHNDFYRPLSLALFAVEYQFFEKNPVPYHFINVLLFMGCVVSLFLFLDKLFDGQKRVVALIAALLFALHPIHTEVVANIKSCDELLCFLFAFISLNLFAAYNENGKILGILAGLLCYFLSLLAKETSIAFVIAAPLIFFFYLSSDRKKAIRIAGGVLAVALVFLAVRHLVLENNNANSLSDILFTDNALARPGLSAASRIATAILVLGYYIKLLLVPYPLSCDYSYDAIPFVHFSDWRVLLSVAVYVALAVSALILFLRNRKNVYAFSIWFYLVTMALFTNIPFLIGAALGERFLFFGSVGYCVALAALVSGGRQDLLKDKLRVGVIVLISAVYVILTVQRNGDWVDNATLFATDVKKYPGAVKLNFLAAVELENSIEAHPASEQPQIIEETKQRLQNALNTYPEYNDAVNNLGEVYFYDKKYDNAIKLFERSIELVPDFVNPYTNIAACFGSLGNYDSALVYAYKAMAVDPAYTPTYDILAQLYGALGKADSANKYRIILQKNGNGK